MKMRKLLLADDHPLFREGFSLMIQSCLPESLIHHVSNWPETHMQAKSGAYDLVFLDLRMPEGGVWQEELKRLIACSTGFQVCIVSGTGSYRDVRTAFELGVLGYIPKTVSGQEMQRAISTLTRGAAYIPDELWFSSAAKTGSGNSLLSPRQHQVLELIQKGYSNKDIGEYLQVSESTVKRHVFNLCKILGARNRVDAVRSAHLKGILGGL